MREIVKRILEENFVFEYGSLTFSCPKIELALPIGSVYEGSFHIFSAPGYVLQGYVTSSDIRMECLTAEFSGGDAEIFYRFHGDQAEAEEVVKGAFSVVSNQGEYYLPFVCSMERSVLQSSQGPITNLADFAVLARNNWQEAVKLFYASDFVQIFEADGTYYEQYRAFSAVNGNQQNMEEFLVLAGLKSYVDYYAEGSQIGLELSHAETPYSVTETRLGLVRNGWGYTSLKVTCEGDFVFTEKEFLTDDDFLGNICRLPVYIDSSQCRQGRNFGKVMLSNSRFTLEIPVTVRLGEQTAANNLNPARKKIIARLMNNYRDFRLKKMGTALWLEESEECVGRLLSMDENDIEARLFQAQLLITKEQLHEAGWILEHTGELLEQQELFDTPLWAYYLYLTTLLPQEEGYGKEISREVELIYRRNRQEWRIAWLLLYLSPEYDKSDNTKWDFLEKQFRQGCTSPIMYIEALQLLNSNPSLLRKLESFSMGVLWFGAKQDRIGPELLEQLLYLCTRIKDYSAEYMGLLERTLIALYRKSPDERILQELCTLFVKNSRVGAKYFAWYAKSVDAQLRITNLYEYYMMSADPDYLEEIPKIVLMYFMYQNNLDYERSAFLYSYILEKRHEYEELYSGYRPRIERFVVDQIQKYHVTPALAKLYKAVLRRDLFTDQTKVPLSKILFAHQVKTDNPAMRRVLVYQPDNEQPAVYALQNGKAWVPLYGEGNLVVLEDAIGNRFGLSESLLASEECRNEMATEIKVKKLMEPRPFLKLLESYVETVPELDIYLAGCEMEAKQVSVGKRAVSKQETSISRWQRIAAMSQASAKLRRHAHRVLLNYYSEMEETEQLSAYLDRITLEELCREDRAELLRKLVVCGKNQPAYEQLVGFTPYFADKKTLLDLLEVFLKDADYTVGREPKEDSVLLATAVHVLRNGGCSSSLLKYLMCYYQGRTKDLCDIWKAAKSYGIEREAFCKRILVQMLFSGSTVEDQNEIFTDYLGGNADNNVKAAFLTKCAHDYFVKQEEICETRIREIALMELQGETVGWLPKLAFLKYFGEHEGQLNEEELIVAERFLGEMTEKKIHLKCFGGYKEFPELLRDLWDKTIVEYRASAEGTPRIRYRIFADGSQGEYFTKYMNRVCRGVYFDEFVLFFGEALEYSILEEKDGREVVRDSGLLQQSRETMVIAGSKYELLNKMLISKSLQEEDILKEQLQDYVRREFLTEELFPLKF